MTTTIIITILVTAVIIAAVTFIAVRWYFNRKAARFCREALDIPNVSPQDIRHYIKTQQQIQEYLLHRFHIINGPFSPSYNDEWMYDRNRVIEQFCRYVHMVGCEVYIKAVSNHDIEQNPKEADSMITHMQHVRDNMAHEILTGHSYPDVVQEDTFRDRLKYLFGF